MKEFLIKSIIFSTLFIFITKCFLDPRYKKQSNFEKSINEFYLEPKDSIDILILGSSHARNTFNPFIIDKALNVNSFNLGSGGQRIIVTNSLLKDILKEFEPKLIILDVFPGSLDFPIKPHQKSNQLQVTDNTKLSINKLQLMNKIFSYDQLPAAFSQTVRNHKKWNKLRWKLNSPIQNNKDALIYKGFSGSYFKIKDKERKKLLGYKEKKNNYLKSNKTNKSFFQKELEELKHTIEICKNNNIEIILVSAPYFNAFYNPQGDNFHYLIKKMCTSAGIHFLDFNSNFDDIGLEMNDFRDRVHVNITGSDKTTKYLVKRLLDLEYFRLDDSETIDHKMKLLDNGFKEIFKSKIEKEILPNVFTNKITISKNKELYEVVLDLRMEDEDIDLIKKYNLEYFATVYEKDKKYLKGIFKNTKREYYTFYNNKIVTVDGKKQIIFRLPVTEIKEFENIRIFSFKKGQKMTTQDYEFNLKNVDLKLKDNANM